MKSVADDDTNITFRAWTVFNFFKKNPRRFVVLVGREASN